jgi:hypothetical protein
MASTGVKNKDFREGVDILFADGETRNIKPLTIRRMRKFMKSMKELGDLEGGAQFNDEQITAMVNAAAIALEQDYPDLVSDLDALEDIIDMKSFNVLMAAAMGADPNE